MRDMFLHQQQIFMDAMADLQNIVTASSLAPDTANPGPSHHAHVSSHQRVDVCRTNQPSLSQDVAATDAQSGCPQGEELIPLPIHFKPTPRPLRTTAAPLGQTVPLAIKQKIWEHKYVELADLIHPHKSSDYTLALSTEDGQPQFRLATKKRKQLTEREWSQAMDVFIAIYTEKYPDQTNAMLTYARNVRDLMSNRANWAWYDTQFRADREFTHCPWDEMRQDLELRAFRPNQAIHDPTFRNTQTNHSTRDDRPDRVPTGYCFAYHSRIQRCTNSRCSYKHTCPRCRAPHPLFMQCRQTSHRPSASITHTRDSNRDTSPKRDHHRNRHTRETKKDGSSA